MAIESDDPFNLKRFTDAQESIYNCALSELRSGLKRNHWMWYIFPQICGLGNSYNSRFYAITSIKEARQFLQHPILSKRLLECTEAVLAINGRSALDIFGYPDNMKLKSSMTLFASVTSPCSVFDRVLEKYFNGEQDKRTLQFIGKTL